LKPLIKHQLIIAFLAILISMSTYGQESIYIKELTQKADKFRDENPDSLAFYSNKILELSLKENYLQGQVDAYTNLGFYNYLKGNHNEAIDYYQQAIALGNNTDAILAYHFLTLVYIIQGRNEEAINALMILFEKASSANNLDLLADVCSNLGLSHLNIKNYEKALDYLSTALKILDSIHKPQSEVYVYLNIGRLYFELTEYDSALMYLNQAEIMGEKLNNDRALLHVYSLLGQIASYKKEYNEAEDFLSHALTIADSLGLYSDIPILQIDLGEIYFQNKKYLKAIESANNSLIYFEKNQSDQQLQRITDLLVKSYIETRDFQAAEEQLNKYSKLKNESTRKDTTNLLWSILEVNKLKADDQDLTVIRNELKLAKSEITLRNILILASVTTTVLSIIILILISRSNQMKTKNNKQLLSLNQEITEQKNKLEDINHSLESMVHEKDLLLAMVAHDIRSPLQRISGLMDIMKLENHNDGRRLQVEEMVQATVNGANQLVNELIEIHQIESGAVDRNTEILEIIPFIHQLIIVQQLAADSKNIVIKTDVQCKTTTIRTDKRLLQRILENLLTNAIKFSERDTSIIFTLKEDGGRIWYSTKDNGKGIPKSEHSHLFTKFGKTSTRPTAGEASTGLGLFIVARLTKILDGTVSFTSEEGKGSEFSVSFALT